MKLLAAILLASALLLVTAGAAVAQTKNGFDLAGALVPAAQIEAGGPPRDGIPAIDWPKFVGADEAHFLRGDDRVLGIVRNGIAKAYPVRILNWHEIVNDRFGNEPIAVTFCPLCGTGIAYTAFRPMTTCSGARGKRPDPNWSRRSNPATCMRRAVSPRRRTWRPCISSGR